MRTIKKAQDGATTPPKKTWQQMTQGEKGNKKKELVEKGGIQLFNKYKDSIGKQAMGRIQTEFEKGAKAKGMTNDQYSKWLEKQKRKPDANQGDGGFKEKRYNPVCGKGGCKSGRSGLRIKKAQNGTATPNYKNIKKPTQIRSVRKTYVPTAKDSTRYEAGFKDAMKGKDRLFPSRARLQGYREAKERGLTPKAQEGIYLRGTTAAPRLPKLKKLSPQEMKRSPKVDISKFKKAEPKASKFKKGGNIKKK
jgi:hypothetical protein